MGASSSVLQDETAREKLAVEIPSTRDVSMISSESFTPQKHSCQSPLRGNSFSLAHSPESSSKSMTYSSFVTLQSGLSEEVLLKLSKHEQNCYRLGLSKEDTFISMMKKLEAFLESGIIDSKYEKINGGTGSFRESRELENDDDDRTEIECYESIRNRSARSKLADLIPDSPLVLKT